MSKKLIGGLISMRQRLFALGAAGNKAAILAEECGVIDRKDILLINSTTTDIPSTYDGQMFELPGNIGGTGKDRNISKRQAELVIKNSMFDIQKFIKEEDEEFVDQVIFVTSTDGGSGSGSTVVFADYIRSLGIPVMIYAFIGRAKDIRGLRNTIEFFKDISGKKYTIQVISNERLSEGPSDTNDSAIEAKANSEFCRSLSVVLGGQINDVDVEQNLDERELHKLRTTPGYMIVSTKVFDDKIKNIDQTRKEITEVLDQLPNPDPDSLDMARLGLIYNCEKSESSYMDILPVVKEKFGLAFEVFTHRQYAQKSPRVISIIMAGLTMPMKEIQDIYDEYKEAAATINKTKDSFFDSIDNMEFDDDSVFDTGEDIDKLLDI